MIAHNPLQGSGRADFPHPALAVGDDAYAPQRIGMTDGSRRQPASDQAPHTIPEDLAVLAALRQRTMPEPTNSESKKHQRRFIHGHPVVADVSTHHCLQPFALFRDRFVHPSLKFGLHLIQFRLQPFAYRLPQHSVHSIASLLDADMRKAEKVECLRFPFSTPLPVVDRKRTKLQQPRFLGMQFQVELSHSLSEFRPKLIGLRFALKAHHDVVRESHDDDLAMRPLPTPCLDPQVERVVKVDVRQERRSTSALRRPFLHSYPFPILQHAGVEPFLDQSHDAPICNPMLDELHKPFVGKPIEEALDVQIEHPVHFSRQQSRIESVQRLMLTAPRPEPIRETEKVRFVDSVQHLDRRALDDLVFQRRYSERSLPPVGLRYIHSTHRLCSVRSAFQPVGKVPEISLQFLPIVPPRLSIHAWSGFLLQREVRHSQRVQVVDVVQERREPQLLVLCCCLTYPPERTERVVPALYPGRVLLRQVPFGQPSSLHPLRRQWPAVVRGLRRYCRAVRLPGFFRHRRTSLDFPMRPTATAALGKPGISRFPREVSTYVHGVSDRAGLWRTSRYRCTRWGLPLSPTASASRRNVLSRLNTQPARSPVNASTLLLRTAPHDSGPTWVATSQSYDFCIHYTSPVSRRTGEMI